jgi:hypothetical protein
MYSLQNLQDSATKAVTSVQNAYNYIQPYMVQINQFYSIIIRQDMSDIDKSDAIIRLIMKSTVNQATQMANTTCSNTGNPLVKFMCNFNTYKTQICSVVDVLASSYISIKTVFDFVTKNPTFVQQLRALLEPSQLQNIRNMINNPSSIQQQILQPNSNTSFSCVKQVDMFFSNLFKQSSMSSMGSMSRNGGANSNTKGKNKRRSKSRSRSRSRSRKRKTVRKLRNLRNLRRVRK